MSSTLVTTSRIIGMGGDRGIAWLAFCSHLG
jgi:hypothetical protein